MARSRVTGGGATLTAVIYAMLTWSVKGWRKKEGAANVQCLSYRRTLTRCCHEFVSPRMKVEETYSEKIRAAFAKDLTSEEQAALSSAGH